MLLAFAWQRRLYFFDGNHLRSSPMFRGDCIDYDAFADEVRVRAVPSMSFWIVPSMEPDRMTTAWKRRTACPTQLHVPMFESL